MKRAALLVLLLMLPSAAMAQQEITVPAVEYDIGPWEQVWGRLPQQAKDILGGLSPKQLISSYREGAEGITDGTALKSIAVESFADAMERMGILIGAVLIISLLEIIIGGKDGVGDMLMFCVTGLCISAVTGAVYEQFGITMETVDSVSAVTEVISPVMMILTAACGSPKTAASQPAVILLCNVITSGFKRIVMPLIPVMCGFTAAAGITGESRLKAVSSLIKSGLKWGMGLAFTACLGSVSIKGLNASGLDRAGVKAIKYAFDKSVPVVGSMISGTYEGLMAGAVVLKNAAGTVAMLLLLITALMPAVNMLCAIFAIRITAAICSLISDSRIAAMLEGAAESCTYMFAVTATVVLMNLITVTSTLIASGV